MEPARAAFLVTAWDRPGQGAKALTTWFRKAAHATGLRLSHW